MSDREMTKEEAIMKAAKDDFDRINALPDSERRQEAIRSIYGGMEAFSPPAPVSIDDKVHAVSLAPEVPGSDNRGVIGHYKIHKNGDRQGTVLGNWDWERVVADAGLTGKWMVLHFTDANEFERDWSLLEATQDSLREHAAMLKDRDSAIADLRAEVEALKSVNAKSIAAMVEAKSLAASVSRARSRQCEVDGVVYYMQTNEWCRWATDEVLPLITSAIDAASLREGADQ